MKIDTSNGDFVIDISIDKESSNKRLHKLSNGDIFNSCNMTLEFEGGMLYGVMNKPIPIRCGIGSKTVAYKYRYVRTGISFTAQELNIISERLDKWKIL